MRCITVLLVVDMHRSHVPCFFPKIILFSFLFLSRVTSAADLVVDNIDVTKSPQLTQTASGIPQVNIVNPQNGLSHNLFEKYSVGREGVVINNSRYSGAVDGIGHVDANKNLNHKAETILFEVTGTSRSDLKGVSTIVGDKASFILANPNGITCDGCGFVNASDVELRTERLLGITSNGRMIWDRNFDGDINIGKGGIIARDSSLLLSSKKIKISGPIEAKDILKVEAYYSDDENSEEEILTEENAGHDKGEQQGRQDKSNNKKQPIVAIDVSTMLPISAGHIYLIATGEGAGVKIATPRALIDEKGKSNALIAAKDGGLHIHSKGRIDITGSIYAKDTLRTSGQEVSVVDTNFVGTEGIVIQAEKQLYSNSNYLISDGDLVLYAADVKDDMNKYDIGGGVKINAANMVTKLGNFSVGKDTNIIAGSFVNKISKIASNGSIRLDVQDDIKIDGGELLSKENIKITAKSFDLQGHWQKDSANKSSVLGEIFAQSVEINAKEKLSNDGGFIHAVKKSVLVAPHLVNSGYEMEIKDDGRSNYKIWRGNILSDGELTIESNIIDNDASIASVGKLDMTGYRLKNTGLINGAKKFSYFLTEASDRLSVELPKIPMIENSGTISSGGKLKIGLKGEGNLASNFKIKNDGYLLGSSLNLTGGILESSGHIYADFTTFNFSDGALIDGDLITGVGGIVSGGKIGFGPKSNISAHYGIELIGKDVESYGRLRVPLIQISDVNSFANRGDIRVGKRFVFNGDTFENFANIKRCEPGEPKA